MKKENLKKYGLVILMVVFTGAFSAQAQQQRGNRPQAGQEQMGPRGQQGKEALEKGPRGPNIPNLTEEQKEQMHAFKIAFEKEALPLKNQVGEKEARLRTLTTAESYDERAVNKVIEEIGELKTEVMKLKVAQGQQVKSILTEEQIVAFNSQIGKGPKQGKGDGPRQGPRGRGGR